MEGESQSDDNGTPLDDSHRAAKGWLTPEREKCLDLFRAISELKEELSNCHVHLAAIIHNIRNEKRATLEDLAKGYSISVREYGEKVVKELFDSAMASAERLSKLANESIFSDHDLVISLSIEAGMIYEKLYSLLSFTPRLDLEKRRLIRSFATGPITAPTKLSEREQLTWDLYDGPVIIEANRLICMIGDGHNVELDRMFRKSVTLLPPRDAATKRDRPLPDKESRNYWLYTLAMEKREWKQIVHLLAKKIANEKKDWEPISTIQGVKDAINSLCERHGLPPVAPRRRGRPRGDKN